MPMSNEVFKKLVENRRLEEDLLLSTKGQDYARIFDEKELGETNRLRNFELIADLLKGAPVDAVTVCAVYWLKHVLAICTYVADRRPGAEGLASRFTDVGNYGYLLEACANAFARKFTEGQGAAPVARPALWEDRKSGGCPVS